MTSTQTITRSSGSQTVVLPRTQGSTHARKVSTTSSKQARTQVAQTTKAPKKSLFGRVKRFASKAVTQFTSNVKQIARNPGKFALGTATAALSSAGKELVFGNNKLKVLSAGFRGAQQYLQENLLKDASADLSNPILSAVGIESTTQTLQKRQVKNLTPTQQEAKQATQPKSTCEWIQSELKTWTKDAGKRLQNRVAVCYKNAYDMLTKDAAQTATDAGTAAATAVLLAAICGSGGTAALGIGAWEGGKYIVTNLLRNKGADVSNPLKDAAFANKDKLLELTKDWVLTSKKAPAMTAAAA